MLKFYGKQYNTTRTLAALRKKGLSEKAVKKMVVNKIIYLP